MRYKQDINVNKKLWEQHTNFIILCKQDIQFWVQSINKLLANVIKILTCANKI